MRFQIVKETFADGGFHYYVQKKGVIFGWTRITDNYDFIEYFDTLEDAMAKVKDSIDRKLATTRVDLEVVFDTGEQSGNES